MNIENKRSGDIKNKSVTSANWILFFDKKKTERINNRVQFIFANVMTK